MKISKEWVTFFVCMAWTGVAAAQVQALAPDTVAGTTRVDAEQVIELAQRTPALVIIDSRKSEEYEKGHIAGAVSLVDTDTTAETLAQQIPAKDSPVLFYCNGERCLRSSRAAGVAVAEGYRNVYWFRGGWEEWISKDLPASK